MREDALQRQAPQRGGASNLSNHQDEEEEEAQPLWRAPLKFCFYIIVFFHKYDLEYSGDII